MKPPDLTLYRLCIALVFTLCVITPSYGQTLEQILADAQQAVQSSQNDRGLLLFEQALTLAQRENNTAAEALASFRIGFILNRAARYNEAQTHLERAVILYQKAGDRLNTGRAYNSLGFTSWGRRNLDAAGAFYAKAAAEFDAAGSQGEKASVLYNFAFISRDNTTRKRLAEEAIEAARSVNNARLEGQALHLLGDIFYIEEDFSSALPKLEEAIAVLERAGADHELARALTSLGRLHRFHGLAEDAVRIYLRAVPLQQKAGDRQGVIQSFDALSISYSQLYDDKNAVEYAQRALDLARETGVAVNIDSQTGRLGEALIGAGRLDTAIELLSQAVTTGSDRRPHYFRRLSEAYRLSGDYAAAVDAATRGIEALREDDSFVSFRRPLLAARAAARSKLNQTPEALADVREALLLKEEQRPRLVQTDAMKRDFMSNDLFDLGIQLTFKTGRPQEALEIAEQARARAFLDLLATRKMGSGPDPELRSPVVATAVTAPELADAARRMNSTVLSYWVAADESFVWVVNPAGETRLLRLDVAEKRLVQLIEGTVTGTQNATAAAQRVRGGDELRFDDSQKTAWRNLYKILVAPIRNLLPATTGELVTVIPHGPLFRIPFAALIDEQNRYLIERYRLHYAPAGAALRLTQQQKTTAGSESAPRYLLIGDPIGGPRMPNGQALPALPGARREIQAIRRLLPSDSVTVVAGKDAVERNVRQLMPGNSVIHIATHAIVRDDQPMDSFLALGVSSKASDEDGRLTAQEVYELDLQAGLVVLSACRTAAGKISGDGIIGLSRAFFYAGAPSVLGTLWDVADEPSFVLTSRFYQAFQRHHDKSRALRDAQLGLLRALRNGEVKVSTPLGVFTLPEHPLLWAGFVLQGQP